MQTTTTPNDGRSVSEPGFECRPADTIETLMHRINRIEGQVRGLRGLLERDTPSRDVLVQTSAIIAAVRSLERVVVSGFVRDSLVPALQAGKLDAIDSFMDCLSRSNH